MAVLKISNVIDTDSKNMDVRKMDKGVNSGHSEAICIKSTHLDVSA